MERGREGRVDLVRGRRCENHVRNLLAPHTDTQTQTQTQTQPHKHTEIKLEKPVALKNSPAIRCRQPKACCKSS
eukprot:3258046-Rhodomonas_salina.1